MHAKCITSDWCDSDSNTTRIKVLQNDIYDTYSTLKGAVPCFVGTKSS